MLRARRGTRARWRMSRVVLLVIMWTVCWRGWAQALTPDQLQKLEAAQQWDEIVRELGPEAARTAEQDFVYASALAHLDRLADAERALHTGWLLAPRDALFPEELAGIAFKQRHYPQAARLLRRALQLEPHDEYANDFLGTVYFLEGNIEAALKYWNRVGKPRIAAVRLDPTPRVDAELLDSAFTFSPAERLQLMQLLDSEKRVSGLGIFPRPQFDLRAQADGNFDVVLRGEELNGFGDTKLEALVQLLRELPFQGVAPEYDNARQEAINFNSLFRWDAQKRRVRAEVSTPFEHRAADRLDLSVDLRDENWAVRDGFTGNAPVPASLNLRREAGAFSIASFARDRFRWKLGAEISHRDFRSVAAGSVLTPEMLAEGYELKQLAEATGTVVRIPDRRFTLEAGANSQAARLWSQPRESSEKLQGSLFAHWFPQAQGDDYEMQQRVRAGKTFGQVPFDELFMLGLERDNDLPLRAHIGTRDGRKGSAPLGRNYLLSSWEVDKTVYSNGIMAVKLGPFVDLGAMADPGTALGSHKWLYDTGAQIKLRVFSTTVAFSYGKDLRSGNNAFYVRLLP